MKKKIDSFAYSFPPITEAVIEIRFAKSIEQKDLHKLLKKFSELYQHKSEAEHVDLAVDIGSGSVKNTRSAKKYRFSSYDQTEVLILSDDSFLVSQLAPYCGWSNYIDRFSRDFSILLDGTSYREIVQIGVRYINRIDLPVIDGKVAHEEYLNVYPSLPPLLDIVDHFATQVAVSFEDIGASLRLNCGLTQSPIANHLSILFDQDIVKDKDLPNSNLDDVLKLLNMVRARKNEVFEASITDKSRGLFNNDKK